MKPIIGIIGGCGPLATVDIEGKILKATKRLLFPLLDQDFFNMLVFNYTQFSDRNDSIAANDSTQLSEFLRCARALESIGIHLLLIACQTAHVYVADLKAALHVPIIDIVEETTNHVVNAFPGVSKIGLLSTDATQKKRLYQNAFASHKIDIITLPADLQSKVMEAIYIIKTGESLIQGEHWIENNHPLSLDDIKHLKIKNHPYRKILLETTLPNPVKAIKEAILYLASQGCKQVILGCTELPLILPNSELEQLGVDLIDSNTIVSEKIVLLAHQLETIGQRKPLSFPKSSNQIYNREVINICAE